MLYYAAGSEDKVITDDELKNIVESTLNKLGNPKKVLALPPDMSRFHSQAGKITTFLYDYYGKALTDIMPAIGTHAPMSREETDRMFPGVPRELFREHRWRKDLSTLGTVPAEFVREQTGGKLDFDWPAQVNSLLADGGHDLILSVGQVVPHEVIGLANYNKNIFVGTGGQEGINKSHFVGAVYGMERIMGRADNPVRAILNYASEHFSDRLPKLVYILTVIGRGQDGSLPIRGLFIGDDHECFYKAAELSLKVNFTMLDRPIQKAVVYLDPEEFKSTWIGNKSIYRTRMAIADGGELIVLAPGVKEFGEDAENDRIIRKYGYVRTSEVLRLVDENEDLQQNLGVAAHLIHGSPEGRFSVTYCPGHLSREEITGAGYNYADITEVTRRYNPENLNDGWNTLPDGEEIYYVSNPAVGLWAVPERFTDN
ncbi:lactate racemase domain-containing protein [Marispirochaeta aestuarii]|uniref:lactate racemase domain-containing protein n=1 Tax=Marispirochaeta aestuarii TaxID=1963862 RepID=UPI002ABE260B|nr:lactate racemase domain-containing protein [Marispirochaeta aestuarii]